MVHPPGNVYGAHHHTHDKVIYVVTGSTALSHTVVTSGTALLVLLALLDLGEILLRDFALALLIGVVVGTNSSIFVAGPIVFVWETWSGRNRR